MADTGGEPRVVVIGGGFGGLYCARALGGEPVRVTLIDRRNFHLFQPLLYQVATGGLSPANIAAPLRGILRYERNVQTIMGDVTEFDIPAREVHLADGSRVPFDTLVVATGSTHHYFGQDGWEQFAPGLKSIEDATEIRARIMSAFERAEREPDFVRRKPMLTFVVVGGGPTGVEMAGAVSELARHTLRRDFRTFDPGHTRIVLVDGGDRVLSSYPEKLSHKAEKSLNSLGVEVWTGGRATDLTVDHVTVQFRDREERIETNTVIWAAGVKASPLGQKLADALGPTIDTDKSGRVGVGGDCSVPGFPAVFVVGDLALMTGEDGQPLPSLAPVAMQQGRYVADVIARRVKEETPPRPFRYVDKGTMATIGRGRAVAQTSWFQFSGLIAWLAWLFIHILYLAQFSNRVLVLFQWFWNYLTRNRSARIITGELRVAGDPRHMDARQEAPASRVEALAEPAERQPA